jgi:hypothetical protein
MLGFHKHTEGERNKQGVNWTWDKSSKPMILIKLGWLQWFFRRRSDWIVAGNPGCNRYFFEFYFTPRYHGANSIRLDFDNRTLIVNDKRVGLEELSDVVDATIAQRERRRR